MALARMKTGDVSDDGEKAKDSFRVRWTAADLRFNRWLGLRLLVVFVVCGPHDLRRMLQDGGSWLASTIRPLYITLLCGILCCWHTLHRHTDTFSLLAVFGTPSEIS